MKKKLKTLFTIFLTALMALAIPATAMAEGTKEPTYEPTDAYVINYANVDYDYGANAPYLYVSPHRGSMGIRDLESGKMEYWSTSQQVYNMINTTKLAEGGSGAYASIPVYCTDACVSAKSGYEYRRINLSDSTYFDEATANHLRAIMLASFPYVKDMSEIEAAVNDWIDVAKPEATHISGLTGAEAITATQYTIWCVANEGDVEPGRAYSRTSTLSEDDLTEVVYHKDIYVDCTEKARDTTQNNIQMLHEYLMNLEGVAANQTAVGDSSLEILDVKIQEQWADDSAAEEVQYTVTVKVKINATITPESDMILSLLSGERNANILLLPNQQEMQISLFDLSKSDLENLKLELNGQQKISGVFLFDATENRENSQSMIGYDSSSLPIHAEALVDVEDVEIEDPIPPTTPEEPTVPETPSTTDTPSDTNTPTANTPTTNTPSTPQQTTTTAPKTGDTTLPSLMIVVVACGALAVCVVAKDMRT